MKLENSLASILAAIEAGANSVEIDVHFTLDDQIVVFHDFALGPDNVLSLDSKRPIQKRFIREMTLTQVQQFYSNKIERLRVPDTLSSTEKRLPTLREVLRAIEGASHPNAKQVYLDIEIKREPNLPKASPTPDRIAELIREQVQTEYASARVALRSFDRDVLKSLQKYCPKVPRVILCSKGEFDHDGDYSKLLKGLDVVAVAPDGTQINSQEVEVLHQLGLRVIPYTGNKPSVWKEWIGWGVDGITTDDPKGLSDYLQKSERGQSSNSAELYGESRVPLR